MSELSAQPEARDVKLALTGPPQSRPSGFVGRGRRNGTGGAFAAGGSGAEWSFF